MPAPSSYEREDRERGELDFQSLVNLHYGPLYRFALSLTHMEHDAGEGRTGPTSPRVTFRSGSADPKACAGDGFIDRNSSLT